MGRFNVGGQQLSSHVLACMKGLGKENSAFDFNGASVFAYELDSVVDNVMNEQGWSDVAALTMSYKPSACGTLRKRVRFQKKVAAEWNSLDQLKKI